MKYVNYDKNTGKILGYYDDTIHQTIPEPNLQITDEQWEKAINNNYNFVDVKNKVLSKKDFRTLDEIKQSVLNTLRTKINKKITSGFKFNDLTIKTDTESQINCNANYQIAVQAMQRAKSYATNTTYNQFDVILKDGVYYITLNGGTTGDTKPEFPTDFQIGVKDGEVTWYKFGVLVSTVEQGSIYFTPQDMEKIYVQFNVILTDLRKTYKEYKEKILACSSKDELNAIKTEIERL